jgi:hypothetical protein
MPAVVDARVRGVELVTPRTLGFPRIEPSEAVSAELVHLRGHGLKVVWIHTEPIEAKVVQFKP